MERRVAEPRSRDTLYAGAGFDGSRARSRSLAATRISRGPPLPVASHAAAPMSVRRSVQAIPSVLSRPQIAAASIASPTTVSRTPSIAATVPTNRSRSTLRRSCRADLECPHAERSNRSSLNSLRRRRERFVPDTFEAHYARFTAALADGQVVPLLGAGVNLCDRPVGADWQDRKLLPSGGGLAQHLAGVFWYPKGEALDLLRVSQWAVAREGPGPSTTSCAALRRRVRTDPRPPLPRLPARRPPRARDAAAPARRHHELRRRARARLRRRGRGVRPRPYIADGERPRQFLHRPPDGEPRLIEQPKRTTSSRSTSGR